MLSVHDAPARPSNFTELSALSLDPTRLQFTGVDSSTWTETGRLIFPSNIRNKMTGYHETYSVQSGHCTVDLGQPFCYFHTDKLTTSVSGRDIHKGSLMMKHDSARKVVVKVRKGVSEKGCAAEVEALKLTQTVIRSISGLNVEVVPTSYSGIITLSKFKPSRDLNVVKGGFVLIQERVNGQVVELWSLDNAMKGQGDSNHSHGVSDLVKLVLAIHRRFHGKVAVSSIKGVVAKAPSDGKNSHSKSAATKYRLTSVTLHSVDKRFGSRDRGTEAVMAFRKWTELNDVENCSHRDSRAAVDTGCPAGCTPHERLQPSAPLLHDVESECEHYPCRVMPTYYGSQSRQDSTDSTDCGFSCDDCVTDDRLIPTAPFVWDQRLTVPVDVEQILRKVLGPPPPYSRE